MDVLLRLPPPRDPAIQLKALNKNYALQVKICQYCSILINNFTPFSPLNADLMVMMRKQLAQMIEVFGWK